MRFEHPEILWLILAAVPALSAFLWWAWRKKRWLISQFVQSRLLANLTVGVSATRQKIRMALLVVAVVCLLIALARPQLGFDWEEARQRGLDIVVAIDTSRSMLADDVTPNRLAKAKLAAFDLRRMAKTDRLGLVAFAGSAFLQCPLSLDDEAFRQSVNALDVKIIPQGGTALAEAIYTALQAFKEKNDNHKVLVLFTDGEDNDGRGLEAARSAAKEGMRIFTVGVGTASGELLRVPDAKGRSEFIKDSQGNVVKSRLNESLLQQIAQATEGFYMLLSGAKTMDVLYERGLAPLPKAEFSARRVKRYHERFQWLLGLAIVLLLVEMFLPERKRVPKTEAILAASANAELRKAVAVLSILLLPGLTVASPSTALKRYESGKYGLALQEFQRLLKERPNDSRLHFNAGAAAYQAKEYEEAMQHLHSSLVTQDLQLQERAYYNLGNTQYRVGEEAPEPDKKQGAWEQALSSYESALKLSPQDEDAKFNLELVKKKLEELKQQQQKQQQQSKDDKQDKSKEGEQSKDDQKKGERKPEDKQSSQDKKQDEQQSDQQQPKDSSKPQDKQGEEKKSQQSSPSDQEQDEDNKEGMDGSFAKGRMTPQQAQQLLDAQKGDETAMIFIPQIRTNRQDRVFKDW